MPPIEQTPQSLDPHVWTLDPNVLREIARILAQIEATLNASLPPPRTGAVTVPPGGLYFAGQSPRRNGDGYP